MRQLINSYPLPIYSIISTFIFLGFFSAIIFWAYGIETKESMDERARIPFQDKEDFNAGVKNGVKK